MISLLTSQEALGRSKSKTHYWDISISSLQGCCLLTLCTFLLIFASNPISCTENVFAFSYLPNTFPAPLQNPLQLPTWLSPEFLTSRILVLPLQSSCAWGTQWGSQHECSADTPQSPRDVCRCGHWADDSQQPEQEYHALSGSTPTLRTSRELLEPGSSSICVGDVGGSERGRRASKLSGKPTLIT